MQTVDLGHERRALERDSSGLDFEPREAQNERFNPLRENELAAVNLGRFADIRFDARQQSAISLTRENGPMVFEHIEKLKQEYTDKYVVVDGQVAELQRFDGQTGTVRTINMNGRALVEFDGHANIGWYDIDIDFLSVVDKPAAKEEKPAKAAAPAKAKPAAAPSKLEEARAKADMSVADVLAAARANKPAEKGGAAAAPAAAKPSGAMSVEDMLAAARAEKDPNAKPAAPAAASGGDAKSSLQQQLEAARQPKSGDAPQAAAPKASGSMSVEEMLAAARAEKGGGAAAPAAPAEEAPAEPAAEEAATDAPAGGGGSKMDEITDVDAQVAYCRQVDGGS